MEWIVVHSIGQMVLHYIRQTQNLRVVVDVRLSATDYTNTFSIRFPPATVHSLFTSVTTLEYSYYGKQIDITPVIQYLEQKGLVCVAWDVLYSRAIGKNIPDNPPTYILVFSEDAISVAHADAVASSLM